jgi:signal transduction histidine kinase
MLIEMEQAKAEQAGRQRALEALASLQASTRKVLADLRQIMLTLRGEPTHSGKFDEWLADLLARFHDETGLETKFMCAESWPSSMTTQASINLSRIIEEALHNIRHHSGAKFVLVSLSQVDGVARMYIRDDGRGHIGGEEPAWQGMGTLGMKERAMLLGGELRVKSGFGHGTDIEVLVPVQSLTT